MRTHPLFRRGIAVVVIALLLALAFIPSINADIEKNIPPVNIVSKDEKLVKLVVTEHKPDGTKESKIVRMLESDIKQLQDDLRNAKDLDERLSIYKNYKLIPEDVTSEKLRAGMEERARQLGLTEEKLEEMSSTQKELLDHGDRVRVLNYLCNVYALVGMGLPLYLGMSFITARVNWFLAMLYLLLDMDPFFFFPGIDVVDFSIVALGEIETKNGLRPDHGEDFYSTVLLLIGFVGVSVSYYPLVLFRLIFFEGFAVVAYARGREWDPFL